MTDYYEKWRECVERDVIAGNLIRTYDRTLADVMGYLLGKMRVYRAEENYTAADEIRRVIEAADILIRIEKDGTVKWMISGSTIGGEV